MHRNAVIRSAIMPSLFGAASIAAVPQAFASNPIFCSGGSLTGFGPAQYIIGIDLDTTAETVFNYLTQFKCSDTKVLPGLVEGRDVSDNGKIYTFHLYRGVKFHSTNYLKPTHEFNTNDMLFTFERMLNKNHPFRKVYPTEPPYFANMGLDKNIARIEKFDEHTVKFILNEVDAAFIQNLAMPFPSIQSAEHAVQLLKQGKASDINQKPIGTGPLVFSRYQKDAQIRFKGSKDYWKPDEVKVDNLIFAINIGALVHAQRLKTDGYQITLSLHPAGPSTLKKDPNLNLPLQIGFSLSYIAYSVTHEPFDKLEVRQALDMAINKEAIIDTIYQNAGRLASNGMPPTRWSHDEAIKDAPYDPVKTKELPKKVGVAEGIEITPWATPVQRPHSPNAKLMAEMSQNDWAKIGIKAKIITYERDEYIKRAKGDEYDVILIGRSGDNGDPDNWLGTLYGCGAVGSNSFSKWCDTGYDKLVKDARRTIGQGKRTELHRQAQHIPKGQVPTAPIAHSIMYQPMRKTVHDFRISPFGLNSFYEVSVGRQFHLPITPSRHERGSAPSQGDRPGPPVSEKSFIRPRLALRYSLLLSAFAASTAAQTQSRTLAACIEVAPRGFDPAHYTPGYTSDVSAHPLYNALAASAPGSTMVTPVLAEGWDVSADGLVYIFRLRQGVKFHSTDYLKLTRGFSTDDMPPSFQRMLDPQHLVHDLSPSGYSYADAMRLRGVVERVEEIDEHQVRSIFKHPEAPFLADLTIPFGSILSTGYAGQLIARGRDDELSSKSIGTGLFVFIRYRKDAQVRYAANPDYWEGKPAIDHLVLMVTLDPNVCVQRLHHDECQITLAPKPEDAAVLCQDP